MAQVFGVTVPGKHTEAQAAHAHQPARYLVLIESGAEAGRVARLFLPDRQLVAEFDAATPEVLSMTAGLAASRSAADSGWDTALAGHSAEERAAAEVYTLGV